MSFRIKSDARGRNYARFLRKVREAIAVTYAQQIEEGYTQSAMAAVLGVDRSVISKRLSGLDNITLKTVADIYFSMGRKPLENFVALEVDQGTHSTKKENNEVISNNYNFHISLSSNNAYISSAEMDDILNFSGVSAASHDIGSIIPQQSLLVGGK